MGSIGPMQLLVVLVVALLLFGGRGRISSIMGDMAKGIKSFRKGLAEDDEDEPKDAKAPGNPKALNDETTIDVTPQKDREKTGS